VRALVIDDSKAIRIILRKLLGELGFEVAEAADGREALQRLNGPMGPFDLALVDWNMPEMNGLEFVREVRGQGGHEDLTMVMVTTETESGQVVRALAAGANEYIMKPFSRDVLVDKLSMLGLVPA
jgi:two-component system, chemotaxis family, chemotaxis protein CheY